ncbi:hypothetical protein WQQ_15390 [Hydrocarboniphaga effusa AP103]|uniref:Uncharacterized protein n=1 Tax=Hydrocarboniphaga effusa AP103 TaxID=1172194 RepID=I7ZI23_9GAMM|nr:hypothetical protein WQQ_15390 [Hydrocarboniphaga effusa AP103]
MKPQITKLMALRAPAVPTLQRSCGMKPQITSGGQYRIHY